MEVARLCTTPMGALSGTGESTEDHPEVGAGMLRSWGTTADGAVKQTNSDPQRTAAVEMADWTVVTEVNV